MLWPVIFGFVSKSICWQARLVCALYGNVPSISHSQTYSMASRASQRSHQPPLPSMDTAKGHLFFHLVPPSLHVSWFWLSRPVMLELGLLLPRPDGEEAKCSRWKPSPLPWDAVIDRRTLSPMQPQQGGRLWRATGPFRNNGWNSWRVMWMFKAGSAQNWLGDKANNVGSYFIQVLCRILINLLPSSWTWPWTVALACYDTVKESWPPAYFNLSLRFSPGKGGLPII